MVIYIYIQIDTFLDKMHINKKQHTSCVPGLKEDLVTRLLNPNPALRGLATQILKGGVGFSEIETMMKRC